MENLRALRDELRRREWVVACFPFDYKKNEYFVLVERYVPPAKPPKYQLVYITFVDRQDTNRTLSGPANTGRIGVDIKDVRKFFRVAWSDNPRDFMLQFYQYFGNFIPATVPLKLGPEEQITVVRQLDKGDSEDPRKRFCYTVRRNGVCTGKNLAKRSLFNSQKTQLLRPALYAHLEADENISFVYSINPEDEQTDEQILDRFATR